MSRCRLNLDISLLRKKLQHPREPQSKASPEFVPTMLESEDHDFSVFEPLEYQDEEVDAEEVEPCDCRFDWNREDARSLREFRRCSDGEVSEAHIPPRGGLRLLNDFQRLIRDGVVCGAATLAGVPAGGGVC